MEQTSAWHRLIALVDHLIGPRTKVRQLISLIAGIACLIGGAFLILRPLTALLTLSLFFSGSLVVIGIYRGLRAPARRRWVVPLWIAAGVGAAVFRSTVIYRIPEILGAVFIIFALWNVVKAVRAQSIWHRIMRIVYALACAGCAYMAFVWPDMAQILSAGAFSLFLIACGIFLIVMRGKSVSQSANPAAHAGFRRVLSIAWVAITLLVCAAVGLGTVTTARVEASLARPDDFYSWDDDIPTTPGTVLRTEPYDGEVPDGAVAIKVLYSTTYSDGSPALASAVVAYPQEESSTPRIVLAWQHGTTGVSQSCGPSVGSGALEESEIPGISRAIERGWAVVATDYPGQGTSGKYPYLIGEGEGRATLDAVRAAGTITEVNASSEVWLWGHSQGGHATLWAGQIAATYAPDLTVLGVASLSSASDPLTLARDIVSGGSSALTSFATALVLVPYSDEYADISLADIVHPAGLRIVESFTSRCVKEKTTTVSALSALALTRDVALYSFDIASGSVHDRLLENVATGIVSAPLFVGQGLDDTVIPVATQRDLVKRACAAGQSVEAHEYAGYDHLGVIGEGSPLIDDLYAWADNVLAGESPSTSQ